MIVVMKKIYLVLLVAIFILALIFRFYAFRESAYFGYDQARDAYEAQDIYQNKNFKVIGPPSTGNLGIYHGPLYWYLNGPVYMAFNGDPYGVSAFYRVANALGVFLIFAIGSLMINGRVGLVAAFLYAISYEETQYSLYVGNPSLAVFFIPLIYLGAVLLAKNTKHKNWPLVLMFGGAAAATQVNLMYAYSFAVVVALILILRKNLSRLTKKNWLLGIGTGALLLSTYVLAEIKYDFREIKTVFRLLGEGFGVMSPGQSKYLLFWEKFITMFRDNFFGLFSNNTVIAFLAVGVSIWVLYKAIKNVYFRILAVWIFSWIFLMMVGGHTGYYTNAGIGVGIIIGLAAMICSIKGVVGKIVLAVVLIFCFLVNGEKVKFQSPKSLIAAMITQTGMKLSDEYKIIDDMYTEAKGKGFTVRLTGIPYKIQTVWAYLFNQYALPKYGYLPFWENGNALGFPGELPVPKSGTTCLRFLVREPTRGLPGFLIEGDEKEENVFSKIVSKKDIGDFLIESRISTDKVCHDNKP